MKISLIAKTDTTGMFDKLMNDKFWYPTSSRPTENLIEFAGRACYQSWSKPNRKTASTPDYIRNVLAQRHFSVVEHVSVSFYLEDVSRSLTHELVRHRHFSFSQLSQRYVDMTGAKPVVHPSIRGDEEAELILIRAFNHALASYEEMVEHFETQGGGLTRKQVREVAREVLPNCTPTSIVVTGNLRSWLEFVEKRCSPAADAAIREAALGIFDQLTKTIPAVFNNDAMLAIGSAQALPEYPEATNG